MASKRQLLCPINGVCRLILLNFKPKGTKIRISNHAIELVDPDYTQGISRWWGKDSRDDICALYTMVVRFIELYLCPAKKDKRDRKIITKYEVEKDIDNMSDLMGDLHDTKIESHNGSDEYFPNDKAKNCLKIMAEYLCEGLSLLQETYNYDNAVLCLQYFVLLIKAGINETYDPTMLPKHLRDEKRNFLDPSKVRDLWDDDKIEKVCDLFIKSFDANNKIDKTMVEAYDKAIYTIK